jgi:hypothetical protein
MVMSDIAQRRRLLHNEQFAPSYGSVPVAKASNLHAGFNHVKRRKKWRLSPDIS